MDNTMPTTSPSSTEGQPTPPPPGDAHLKSSNAFLDSLLGSSQPQGQTGPTAQPVPSGYATTPNMDSGAEMAAKPEPAPSATVPTTPPVDINALNPLPSQAAPQSPVTAPQPQAAPEPVTGKDINEVLKTPENMPGAMPPEVPKKSSKAWIWVILIILVGAVLAYYFISQKSKTATQFSGSSISVTSTQGGDLTRQTDLVNIQKALEQYYLANNQKYPVSKTLCRTQDADCVLNGLVSTYIAKLPVDPVSANYYGYKSEDGSTYELSAIFTEAPQGIKSIETGKGFLVTLSPSTTIQSVSQTSSTSSSNGTSSNGNGNGLNGNVEL
jgi:hypothetical protein